MEYREQFHYPYKDLIETGRQVIYTKDINAGTRKIMKAYG